MPKSKLTSRRRFLKTIPAAVGTLYACRPGAIQKKSADLYDTFVTPPGRARPFYRWWWNGNRVTAKEVRRELKLMKQAGAGGVEINPIALHELYGDPPQRPLVWLSDEWNAMLKSAVDTCKEMDLIADLIVGTGWPFGGEFLSPQETIMGIELEIKTFTGPADVKQKLELDGKKLYQLLLYPRQVETCREAVDMLPIDDNEGTLTFKVPPGTYDLYIVTLRHRFRDVLFGAPGGAGPVLDHFSQSAVESYLHHMSGALNPLFGGKMGYGIRAMFCDSIELEGANWTADLPMEFKNRRGYDLLPYLPLVLNQSARLGKTLRDTVCRVRYDFSLTLNELFMERFIKTFHNWCSQNKTKSRYQAYGHPWLYTDLLDGYLVPDIPESDQWLFNAGWVNSAELDEIRYATWNKYASSGGHLTSRKIISCEAMTNTRGVFEATLEYIKQATDINIVTGINHLVLHGFNYSPPEAGFPGWIRFGTYFNEHNTWWPFVKLWSDYAARLCAVFQASEPVAQVAIMGPTADVWRQHGLDRNPWITTPWYLHAIWQAFNHHGYISDYVNPTILQNAGFQDGLLHYGPMQYHVLVVIENTSMDVQTVQAILRYVQNGGRVVFVNSSPHRAPGLLGRDKNDHLVRDTMGVILEQYPERVFVAGAPSRKNIIPWAGEVLRTCSVPPSVGISHPHAKLFLNHHRKGDRDIFFLVNMDRRKKISFRADFNNPGKTPWLWDPETGRRSVFAPVQTTYEIELTPLKHLLLVFEPGQAPVAEKKIFASDETMTVSGPWQVTMMPAIEGETKRFILKKLKDLAIRRPEFAGTIIYRTTFKTGTPRRILKLGRVCDIAQVFLNGEKMAVSWWGERMLDISGACQAGHNELEIHVTTRLYNYVRSLADKPAAQVWISRSKRKKPVPIGLMGPVEVV